MGVDPQARDSASISSADFNENGFIDEEDLEEIVLRLLKSDDASEDLLMDVMHHVCIQRLKGGTWVVTQSSQIQAFFSFLFSFSFLKDLFIICKYTVAVFRNNRRGHQISLQMVVSHHVVAGI
jgi:hypothetical protein